MADATINSRMQGGILPTLLSALTGILFLCMPVVAEDVALPQLLEGIRTEFSLPALAAAVVQDGDVVAAAAVGTRVLGIDLPVSIDDRFHLGSNTKSMTATLAGMMVEEGKLAWNSSVGEILADHAEGMDPTLAAATLEQLLSHSSGIPSDSEDLIDLYFSDAVFDANPPRQREDILDAWKHNAIVVPEGSPFQYSNMGYMIAGMMIEKVAGAPWEQLMHERIFDPLGLETAGLGPQTTYGRIDAPAAHRINPDGTVTPMLWGPSADVPPALGPAGNAHMSIGDYAKWAGWNTGMGKRDPVLVSAETLAHIQAEHVQTPVRENPPPGTPTTGGYGLGWSIVAFDWADHAILTHNGSNSMNLARIVVDTDRDLTIVVATNFPGVVADTAAGRVLEMLYARYGQP
jgi:CubicO group peptidase (beta-lactamase class C family)